MAKYRVKRPIKMDGKRLEPGRTIDLDAELAGPLEEVGAVVPVAPESGSAPEKPKRGGKRG